MCAGNIEPSTKGLAVDLRRYMDPYMEARSWTWAAAAGLAMACAYRYMSIGC